MRVGFEKRMAEYEVRFNTRLDPDYEEEVKAFYLTERYTIINVRLYDYWT